MSRVDCAVGLNPLHGIGRLLRGYAKLSQIGELPRDDLCIRTDPLQNAHTRRAERAVPVVDQYRTLSTAHVHILAMRCISARSQGLLVQPGFLVRVEPKLALRCGRAPRVGAELLPALPGEPSGMRKIAALELARVTCDCPLPDPSARP